MSGLPTHPFRFSITATGARTARELTELARRAEDLGYASVTMPDHLDDQLAPLIALTHVAAVTTTLRLTTLVLANDYRHPAVLAKEVATLDVLSEGRVELGIGAGWMQSDYEQAGIPYDRPGVRIERLAESVPLLRRLLAGEEVTVDGAHYRIDGLTTTPPCVQRPHPPILLAGGAPRMLALAAREADILGLNPSLAAGVIDARAGATATPAATDEKLRVIREAAGDRLPHLELQTRVHLAMVTDDRDGVAAAMAPVLGITPEDALGSPHALVGTVEQLVDALLAQRERWGISYIGVPSDAVETFAPVVARLAGT
jgi:probable F420-dependent oxidoreductase